MYGIKEFFSDLNKSVQWEVTFEDSPELPVKGKCNTTIQTKLDIIIIHLMSTMFHYSEKHS